MNKHPRQDPTTNRCGIIYVHKSPKDDLISKLLPKELTIDDCDTQGFLRNKGVFEAVRKGLLLPDSFTICYMFLQLPYFRWAIVVESPDLPEVPNDITAYPEIRPQYVHADGKAHLEKIEIFARYIVGDIGTLYEERKLT